MTYMEFGICAEVYREVCKDMSFKSFLRKIYFRIRNPKRYGRIKRNINCVKCKTERCGNEYGGFEILLDPLLKKNKIIVYSFGIGEDLSFSEDIIKQFGGAVEVYAFDPTPKSFEYVKKNPLYSNAESTNFRFYNYALASENGEDIFYLPTNENYVSGALHKFNHLKSNGIQIQKKTLKTIMEELGHDKIDLLKMDIEGSEFEVVENIINDNIQFTQFCIEVHDRFFEDKNQKLDSMLQMLQSYDYILINMSDDMQEFTFIKRGCLREENKGSLSN